MEGAKLNKSELEIMDRLERKDSGKVFITPEYREKLRKDIESGEGFIIPDELLHKYGALVAFKIASIYFNMTTLDGEEEYRMLRSLRSKKLIDRKTISQKQIVKAIKTRTLPKGIFMGLKSGLKTCDWCGNKVFILHEHHYPVNKIKGGGDTIKICPNCHCEYHYLEATILYDLKKEDRQFFDKFMEGLR